MAEINVILDKLKIANYNDKLFLNRPDYVLELQDVLADHVIQKEKYDFILIFVFSLKEFEAAIDRVVKQTLLNEKGYLYLIYPKKGNKHYKEFIHRDSIMTLPMDEEGYFKESLLKFSRMMAFNEIFTACGLKYEKRTTKKANKVSQCVEDYIDKVEVLKAYFRDNVEVLKYYEALTPGYQRDWARYVYSAKTQATIDKRLIEMEEILKQGFKTKQLYQRSKKQA